jgi:hypothetical protein
MHPCGTDIRVRRYCRTQFSVRAHQALREFVTVEDNCVPKLPACSAIEVKRHGKRLSRKSPTRHGYHPFNKSWVPTDAITIFTTPNSPALAPAKPITRPNDVHGPLICGVHPCVHHYLSAPHPTGLAQLRIQGLDQTLSIGDTATVDPPLPVLFLPAAAATWELFFLIAGQTHAPRFSRKFDATEMSYHFWKDLLQRKQPVAWTC